MDEDAGTAGDPREGPRERRRRDTRRRIVEAGLRMFLDRGYEATTLDAVAAAAGVSRRTVFHHVRSKEDILLAWQDGFGDQLRAAVAAQPPGGAPLAVARRALLGLAEGYASDEMVAIDRLVRSSAALQARKQGSYLQQERALFEALAKRWPDPREAPVLRQVAMAAVGVLRLALEAWHREGCARPVAAHLEGGFASLPLALGAGPPRVSPEDPPPPPPSPPA